MTTFNGFLSQQIGEPPRITEGQKDIVLRGVGSALRFSLPGHVAAAIGEIVAQAMVDIPDSTACACCDFYREGDCAKWESEIPADWLPKGCDHFQDSGAPF